MREHREAMACCDLEGVFHIGIVAHRAIKRQHHAWRDMIGLSSNMYRLSDAEELAAAYRRWMEITDELLPLADRFESQGYRVENVDRIREYYRETSLLPLDVSELSASFKRLESGEGLELDEFFDALSDSHQ
jgi:hypothetical protein